MDTPALSQDAHHIDGAGSGWMVMFASLFIFRYARLIGNCIAYYFAVDTPPPEKGSTLSPQDCTIIIPTVDAAGPDFPETLRTALANNPAEVIIVTVGRDNVCAAEELCAGLNGNTSVMEVAEPNKRQQVLTGVGQTQTSIVVTLDDHVFLPPGFLNVILPPFENPSVGGVGTKKQVRRVKQGWTLADFTNFLGCIYLERRNFDMAATNTIDGGVSCLSGRAACYRTSILADRWFQSAFLNEYQYIPFIGMMGPMSSGDDKFITRWLTKKGWDIKIQFCDDGMTVTTLGDPKKWLKQCLRWSRTTWRDNPRALFSDRAVWRRHPWCVYSVYLSSFVNFALFYDLAMMICLGVGLSQQSRTVLTAGMLQLIAWILTSKFVKLIPYFRRCLWEDWLYFPGLVLFGWFHSFLKFWALLTCWDTQWSGRNLAALGSPAESPRSNGDNSNTLKILKNVLTSTTSPSTTHTGSASPPVRKPAKPTRLDE